MSFCKRNVLCNGHLKRHEIRRPMVRIGPAPRRRIIDDSQPRSATHLERLTKRCNLGRASHVIDRVKTRIEMQLKTPRVSHSRRAKLLPVRRQESECFAAWHSQRAGYLSPMEWLPFNKIVHPKQTEYVMRLPDRRRAVGRRSVRSAGTFSPIGHFANPP